MSWVGYETRSGGRVEVRQRTIVAIDDEQSGVELATAAGGEHVLKHMAVQRVATVATG
jgi:hypothetical protein